MFGDTNGDGATDLTIRQRTTTDEGTSFRTHLGNGRNLTKRSIGVIDYRNWPILILGDMMSRTANDVGDFNGDGRSDFFAFGDWAAKRYDTEGAAFQMSPDGKVARAVGATDGSGPLYARLGYLIDANGDGLDDSAGPDGVRLKLGPFPDLLKQVQTPLGGTISVEYSPSSDGSVVTHTASNPLPYVTQVVKSITTDSGPNLAASDDRRVVAKTSYSYTDSKYDAKERRFLGFRTVTAKLPCESDDGTTCPHTVVTFDQSLPGAGSVEKLERYAGTPAAATLLERRTEGYAVRVGDTAANLPWRFDNVSTLLERPVTGASNGAMRSLYTTAASTTSAWSRTSRSMGSTAPRRRRTFPATTA